MDFDRKFIDTIELDEWEVETDTGWSDINAIGMTVEYDEWLLRTNKLELICADTHIVFDEYFNEIFIKDLRIGDKIITKNGLESVQICYNTKIKSNMYDLSLNDINHRYYTNDILSHTKGKGRVKFTFLPVLLLINSNLLNTEYRTLKSSIFISKITLPFSCCLPVIIKVLNIKKPPNWLHPK